MHYFTASTSTEICQFSLKKDEVEFSYSEKKFHIVPQNNDSLFDRRLKCTWEKYKKVGYFKHLFANTSERILPGKYHFISKLNKAKDTEIYLPNLISNVNMRFKENDLNFDDAPDREIIMDLKRVYRLSTGYVSRPIITRNVLMINVNPFEYGETLLIPYIDSSLSQVLTDSGLCLAIEVVLLSQDPALKIGYNSLGGFASVNQLHFNIHYIKHSLYIEDMAVNCLKNECFETVDFPSQGFVFQIINEEFGSDVKAIMKLIDFLIEKNIAHNLFITRGTRFDIATGQSASKYNAIRVYVWARRPFFGIACKTLHGFIWSNPAACELGGYFPMKNARRFDAIKERDICLLLKEACLRDFLSIREEVKNLYEHN